MSFKKFLSTSIIILTLITVSLGLTGCPPAPVAEETTPEETTPTEETPAEDGESTEINKPADKYNMSGDYVVFMTTISSSGPCPADKGDIGTATIVQSGTSFTLTLKVDCRPAGACSYQGTVSGVWYRASNEGVADDEGGRYTNLLTLNADTVDDDPPGSSLRSIVSFNLYTSRGDGMQLGHVSAHDKK